MKWLHFILSHSLFVACCAIALVFQTNELLQLEPNYRIYGFTFFATLCSYNFYWLLSKYAFNITGSWPRFIQKEKTGIVIFFLSGIGLLFFLKGLPVKSSIIITAMLLTVLYALPLLPFPILAFTRKAGVLKTLLLAFTWTYVTAFIPMQQSVAELSHEEILLNIRRFLFMLILCIIFDNRDSAVDKIRGMRSLSTDLSATTVNFLVYGIFALLFTINFIFLQFGISIAQSLALQISCIALLVTYLYSKKKQGYLFYYFFVDGLMLFSALATYIAGI